MSEPTESNLSRRIWRSIFPAPLIPVDVRERRRAVLETLLLHIPIGSFFFRCPLQGETSLRTAVLFRGRIDLPDTTAPSP